MKDLIKMMFTGKIKGAFVGNILAIIIITIGGYFAADFADPTSILVVATILATAAFLVAVGETDEWAEERKLKLSEVVFAGFYNFLSQVAFIALLTGFVCNYTEGKAWTWISLTMVGITGVISGIYQMSIEDRNIRRAKKKRLEKEGKVE